MQKPVIIVIGNPAWLDALREEMPGRYRIMQHTERSGYMNALIENRAALVLVDSKHQDAREMMIAPGVSPATRRIPVFYISDKRADRAQAIREGATLSLSTGELLNQIGQLLTNYARVPDAETLAQLDCDCQESLPPLAVEGVEKFNAGEYYAQHDLFEEQWVNTTGPVRDLYRAVLQVGVAYFQIKRGNYRGALKMLQRSVQWLVVLPDVCQGIDVKQLREDSFRVRAELERLGEDRMDEFDHNLIRGVPLVSDNAS